MSEHAASSDRGHCCSCAAALQPGARFCTECATRVCWRCGDYVVEGDASCNGCGGDLRSEATPTGVTMPGAGGAIAVSRGGGLPALVLLAGAALFLIVIGSTTFRACRAASKVTEGSSGSSVFDNVAGRVSSAPMLFEDSNTGSSDTDTFFVANGVQICWELTGSDPFGKGGPEASFSLQDSAATQRAVTARNKHVDGCTVARVPPGVYFIKVNATAWTHWHLSVREG